MTPRERLFAALAGRPTDRVPVWLLFPYHPTSYYVDVRTLPAYKPVFEASKKYAFMLNRRSLGAPLHTEEVLSGTETITENNWQVTRSWLEYSGQRLTAETRRRDGETRIKKMLETDADLELYCSLPIETRPERLQEALDRQLPVYQQEKDDFPEAFGAMMLDNGEPIGPLYHNSNLESYAVWSLSHDDLIVDLLERIQERLRIIYRYCLERDLADVYFLVGSELAAPPLVSRATFQRWVVPHAKELIAMIRDYGKKSIQHFHGQIRDLLPDFVEMAPDGLHTIEAPPVGNCTLAEAFARTDNQITLIGNVQYDDLRKLSDAEMAASVKAVLNETRGKRFILSPTAGPFDPEVPEQITRNYHVLMRTAWEYKL
jgi:uroporphyrinogen-III decarboxylase